MHDEDLNGYKTVLVELLVELLGTIPTTKVYDEYLLKQNSLKKIGGTCR